MYEDERYWIREGGRKCRTCGRETDGPCRCPPCADRHNERMTLLRRERVRAGLCAQCGARSSSGKWRCGACQTRHNECAASRSAIRKVRNLCIDCGRLSDHGVRCSICAARNRRYQADWRARGGER